MGKRWIDIAADFKSGGREYLAGERICADAVSALRWVNAGWAKDSAGELPSGVPDTSPKVLSVKNGVHGTASEVS